VEPGATLRGAVLQLDFVFETAGVMVHDGVLPPHTPKSERERMNRQAAGEWWQWLVERMDKDPAPGRKERT
jgi:hypothetical protein